MSETPARGSSSSSAGARRAAARPALPPHVAAMCETLARELGDPVSGLQGFAEQLLRRLGKTDARGDVESIRAEARRCAEIVEQLTALQHGNVFQRVPVTPAQLLSHVTVASAERRRREHVEWTEEVSPEAPDVAGDPLRLQRALEALIDNALDAIAEFRGEGRIRIAAGTDHEGRLMIRVQDDGPGMSRDRIGQAADPFFTTKEHGLGLGLPLAQQNAAEHEGEFHLAATLGGRTAASLLLPAWNTGAHRVKVDSPAPERHERAALLALNDPDAVVELAAACELLGWRYHVAVNADDAALLASRGGYDAAVIATGMLAGEIAVADIVERQRGMKGRVIRLRLPDGPPAARSIEMPDSPESLAVALGLALAGQAGLGW